MLIAVEGCDLFGKSTLIKELGHRYPKVLTSKEPGSPHVPVNKQIREIVLGNKTLTPMQRELLFYTDAIGHKNWLNSFPQKQTVISDRGILTHYAYLYGYMKMKMLGSDPDENYTRYKLCKDLIKATCAKPDVVIYLDGDVTIMEERMNREKDAIESLPSEYFAYVLAHFDDLVKEEERVGTPTLVLQARDSIAINTAKAICYLDKFIL